MAKRAPLSLTFPKISFSKNCGNYATSKQLLRKHDFNPYKLEEQRTDVQLDLISAEKKYNETITVLEQKRKFEKEARKKLDKQWEELRQGEENFRECVMNMAEFLQSNYAKRERALVRAEEYRDLILKRKKQIEDMKTSINHAKNANKDMEKEIKELNIYTNFLNEVVNSCPEFHHVDELIERYDTLSTTNQYLAERRDEALGGIELLRIRTVKVMEEGHLVVLGLLNVVAELRNHYFVNLGTAARWELTVFKIRDYLNARYKEISFVKECSWNLYKTMCERKGDRVSVKDEEDVEKQLIYIKKTLYEIEMFRSKLGNLNLVRSSI